MMFSLVGTILFLFVVLWSTLVCLVTWDGYGDGVHGVVVPLWNTLFLVGTVAVLIGLSCRREWARQWASGICIASGLFGLVGLIGETPSFTWISIPFYLITGVVLMRAQRELDPSTAMPNGPISRLLSTLIFFGSIAVSVVAAHPGTERGRLAFAAAQQQKAHPAVKVTVADRELRLETPDPDERVRLAAEELRAQFAVDGRYAKVWLVGFSRVVITNHRVTATLTSAGDLEVRP